jgi:sulfite reductase (ferredoxin)
MMRGFLSTSSNASTRGRLHVCCVATPSRPPAARLAKRSKVEIIKEKSDFLRHPLMEELVDEKTYIGEESMQLMKFHGSYMQDHREKRAFGAGKAYMFMMRTRQPAGAVTNQLYLAMDDLADKYGNGTLRLTTRQAYQLHGVLKHDLKTVFRCAWRVSHEEHEGECLMQH